MGIASGVFTASLDVDPDRMVARDAAGRPLPPSPISPQGRKRAMWFSTTLYFAQTVSSAVTVLGALAVLRGRGYVLAVAGCLARSRQPGLLHGRHPRRRLVPVHSPPAGRPGRVRLSGGGRWVAHPGSGTSPGPAFRWEDSATL